ncbi:MAG: SDR family NAD(P)-dependent oxidoreductase, partial [Spirochaetota bacterium]
HTTNRRQDVGFRAATALFGHLGIEWNLLSVVPIMNSGGRIINISSGMGQLSDMGSGAIAYRLSKTGLNALSKVLSNELKANNISVNTICPGWVKTDMGGTNATRTVADTVSKIASFALSKDFPNGQFLRDGVVIPW